jgi:hypothetical protein
MLLIVRLSVCGENYTHVYKYSQLAERRGFKKYVCLSIEIQI